MSGSALQVEDEDISGFQSKEEMKSAVKRNMTFLSTLLFLLAVLVVVISLGDTYISGELQSHNEKKVLSPNISNFNLSTEAYLLTPDEIYIYSLLELILKSLITFLTAVTSISLYIYYKTIFKLKVLQNLYPPTISFFCVPSLLKDLVLEMLICILHLPPLVIDYTGISYRYQIIVFIRLYLTGRFLKHKHELMNSKSTRFLASVTKTELSSLFLSKTFFMHHPFKIIIIGYSLILFLGGYAMWLIEEKRYTYQETLWMIAITTTTVGYGDYTPKTLLGRTLIGFTSMVGIFIMALFVSLVNDVLALQQKEKRILSYVETQEAIRKRKVVALNAIGSWYKFYSFQRKYRYQRNGASENLIPQTKRQVQMDILMRFKRHVLELKMIKAINLWRNSKEENVNRNFNHEFMIEDIKIMVSSLIPKVEYFIDKLSLKESSSSLNMVKTENDSSKSLNEKEGFENEKRKRSPASIQSQPLIHERNNNCQTVSALSIGDENEKTGQKFDDRIQLHEVIVNGPGKNHRHKQMKHTLNVALQLLENQTLIMRNNLNESYRKSKQEVANLQNRISMMNNNAETLYTRTREDLYDLHNIIRSLQFCREREIKDNIYESVL